MPNSSASDFKQAIDPLVGKVGDDLVEKLNSLMPSSKIALHYDNIDKFRLKNKLPIYDLKDGKTGTVAKVEIGKKTFYGINSSLSSKTLDLRRKWFNKVKWVPPKKKQPKHLGHAQSLTHAEAHTLMNAYEKVGHLPKKVIMYVDRPTCNMCKGELPALMKAMEVDELIIYNGKKQKPLILTVNF